MHLDGAELTTVLCVGHQGVGQPASTLPQSSDGEARCDCSGREARNSVLGSYRDSKSGRCLWDTSTRKREKWFSPSPVPSAELLTKGSKEEQRDYVFYLAVGNYRLKVRQATPSRPHHPTWVVHSSLPVLSRVKPEEGSRQGVVSGTEVQDDSRSGC